MDSLSQQCKVARMFKRFSTFQNIVEANNRRFGMHKNTIIDSQTMGMTVQPWTGQSKRIGVLNGLEHSISHSTTQQLDTALAKQQLTKK